MGIEVYSVVISLKGRDKGGYFAVLGLEGGGFAFIADGRRRRIEKPKKKKLKHLAATGQKISSGDTETNRRLSRALAKAVAAAEDAKGGI